MSALVVLLASVAPSAGAWIEINNADLLIALVTLVAPSAGAWIEIEEYG